MIKFVADKMLGRLSKWLRILGFDTVYLKQSSQDEIKHNVAEGRILLTRNRSLLKAFPEAVFIVSNHLEDQLKELSRKGYLGEEDSFKRCLVCNEVLLDLPREEVNGRVPEYVRETASSFCICPVCRRIYWPGTHLSRMKEIIRQIKG